jgi:hypothetical protein
MHLPPALTTAALPHAPLRSSEWGLGAREEGFACCAVDAGLVGWILVPAAGTGGHSRPCLLFAGPFLAGAPRYAHQHLAHRPLPSVLFKQWTSSGRGGQP